MIKMENCKTITTGYLYWVQWLLSKLTNHFEVYSESGQPLPAFLDLQSLELQLVWNGWAPIFYDKKLGLISPSQGLSSAGSISGLDMNNHATTYVLASPVIQHPEPFSIYPYYALSHSVEYSDKCVVIYNQTLDSTCKYLQPNGLRTLVGRYARTLAEIDASIQIATVNTRMTDVYVAPDKASAATVKETLKRIKEGESSVVEFSDLLNKIEAISNNSDRSQALVILYDLKERTLRSFFESVGVNKILEKRERLITDEAYNPQLLLINVEDMLLTRKLGWKQVNALFGTDYDVRIRGEYDPQTYMDEEGETETEDENDESI